MSGEDMKLWIENSKKIFHPKVIVMFFFGFSAGIPLLLIFSSLSLWLREAGVDRGEVTFFSWAALGYSFKFIWAPLVDRLPLPILTRLLGRRRSWILFSQLMIISSISLMAFIDPSTSNSAIIKMAFAAVLLGFSAATQDIVIDAYRIEIESSRFQALLSSSYIAGYRVGMIASGAGALFAADIFGSSLGHYMYSAWFKTYLVMASFMLVGIVTSIFAKEPKKNIKNLDNYLIRDYLGFFVVFVSFVFGFVLSFYFLKFFQDNLSIYGRLISFFAGIARFLLSLCCGLFAAELISFLDIINKKMISVTYVEPVVDFFKRYGIKISLLLLMLIGLYRISDIVLGVVSNIFYQDMGFTKTEIAGVVKTFGLFMTISGGFIGGILSLRFGIFRILMLGALCSSITNLLFMLFSVTGNNIYMLYFVISADNLSAGIAGAAFVAFLSGLTSVEFTAVQYAVFSSLMTLIPKFCGGYSGTIVNLFGYETFFFITFMIGLPVIFLLWICSKYVKID